MSYSRQYHEAIQERVSWSYKDSEGHTHHESKVVNIPIDINISVETDPFDGSIVKTVSSVDSLTGAIASMKAVQCATVKENAEKISGRIVDGFYNLIKSDLTMKSSENNSKLQAKMALLLELSRDVERARARMADDIERLRAHYSKIFKGIDDDLNNRIHELDKPAFTLGNKIRNDLLLKPYLSSVGKTEDNLNSNNQVAGRMSAARLKRSASSALNTITESIDNSLIYKERMTNCMSNEQMKEIEQEFVPVAYCIMGDKDSNKDLYYAPEINNVDKVRQDVASYVKNVPADKWRKLSESDCEYIDKEFTGFVDGMSRTFETDEKTRRVYSQMLKLWNENKQNIAQINL